MASFNRWVTTHPRATIACFLVATVVLGVRIPELRIDTDVVSLVPEGHPERDYFEWAEDYFDSRPAVILIVVGEGPDGVFTPDTLALIRHLSDGLAALDAIDDDVTSLSAVDNIRGERDVLVVEPFFEEPPATPLAARAVRAAVFDNPMMVGRVITADGRAAAVGGKVLEGFDKGVLYDDLKALVAAAPITSERVIIAGRPVLDGEWGRLAREDLRLMLPLVLATVTLFLGLLMRSVRGALLPVLVVVTAVIWTVGLMAWTGATFYVLSSLMPALLVAIGVADGVHVIHHFSLKLAQDPDRPLTDTVFTTMEEMSPPVVMTSVTTAAGFASLALAPLTSVKSFGLFTALGVLAAMVFSLTILPALLCLLPAPRGAARHALRTRSRSGPVGRLMGGFAPLVVERPRSIVGAAVLIVAAGLSGVPRIVVDGSLIRNFPASNIVRRADAELIRYFGGSYPMQVVFTAATEDAWKDPAKLEAVAGLQSYLETEGHTGKTRSIGDYLKRMNQALRPDYENAFVLPASSEAVAQYLLLYSMSGEPDDFDDVVDHEYRRACMHALVRADHSPLLKRVLSDIHAYSAEHLAPLGIETRPTGNAALAYAFIELITKGQVRSLLFALVLITLVTGLLCGAAVAGVFVVAPVAMAIALNFGALGWFGIPLGATTAMVSSIGIGIGVDYAIHFLLRYRAMRREGVASDAAVHETLSTAGVAIFYNAVVVLAGFLVLASSQFPPQRAMGLLVAMNMLVCFLGAVTVMATLLHHTQPAFVRPRESGGGRSSRWSP